MTDVANPAPCLYEPRCRHSAPGTSLDPLFPFLPQKRRKVSETSYNHSMNSPKEALTFNLECAILSQCSHVGPVRLDRLLHHTPLPTPTILKEI